MDSSALTRRDTPPPSSPPPMTTQASAATPSPSPPASCITSTLSPSTAPFFSSGRSKAQRWEDSSPLAAGSEEPPSPPPRPSYRDVVASRPAPVERASSSAKAKPPPRCALAPVVGLCSSLSKAKSDMWIKVESRWAFQRTPAAHPACCFRCFEPGHRARVCPRWLAAPRQQRQLQQLS
jgi:hypothetical protein